MRVEELMTRRVFTLSPGQTLREVAQVLSKHDISGGPVVDEAGSVVGYLTRTDLIEAFAHSSEPGAVRVEEAMSREVLSIAPDASLEEALKVMVFEGVHHLLVRVGSGEPLGVLSSLDVFRGMSRAGR